MFLEIRLLRESFGAALVGARIGFLSRVNPQMIVEVVPSPEHLGAPLIITNKQVTYALCIRLSKSNHAELVGVGHDV